MTVVAATTPVRVFVIPGSIDAAVVCAVTVVVAAVCKGAATDKLAWFVVVTLPDGMLTCEGIANGEVRNFARLERT